MENIFLGAGALGGILWAVWERWQKAKMQSASVDAAVSINTAQEQMFTLMTARLTAIENDYNRLRDELTEERKYSRMLDVRVQQYQLHVMKLEAMMRASNLEPPELTIRNVHD